MVGEINIVLYFVLPILEAMSLGTPVITSNIGAMKEIAGAAASLVNPYDVDDIANGITILLNNQNIRDNFRSKGIARADSFSWDNSVSQLLEVYKSV